jgi:preprotein translocase subunit SecY
VILLRTFRNIFKVEELRNKLLFTFAVLAVYRFGKCVPLPGINTVALQAAANSSFASGFLHYINLMSGGALGQGAILALGVLPYITASIMMQILTVAMPSLEALAKEGESGRRVINQYTRYLTIGLALLQSSATVGVLERAAGGSLVLFPGWGFRLMSIMILTVGALFTMWLGEQIANRGIGPGASLIIFAGIVAGLPTGLIKVFYSIRLGEFSPLMSIAVAAFIVALTACIIFLERGERRIPVQYARRVVGRRVFGGMNTYIPLKLNPVGVMPVILTGSMLAMVSTLGGFLVSRFGMGGILSDLFSYGSPFFLILRVVLIIFFSFVYTSITYNPEQLADDIRRASGFIPGIRPGRRTAQFFNHVLVRLGTVGAIYLATLSILPEIAFQLFGSPVMVTGLSLLIAVGVAMDTSSQIESALIERRYEGFLSNGRLKGRRG